MKPLIVLFAFALCSCGSNSANTKVYEDSARYYSDKLSRLTDSGFSSNDSIAKMQKTRIVIYKTMRQHYLDKMKAK